MAVEFQLTGVRYLGRFLPDPRQVPAEVVKYLAEQLGLGDPGVIKEYGERDGTARTHAGEIQQLQGWGWRDFSEVHENWPRGWMRGLDYGGRAEVAVRRAGRMAAGAAGASPGGERRWRRWSSR